MNAFTPRRILMVSMLTFALVVLASLSKEGTILGQNDGSRWDTVWSLTHGNGFVIDSAPYSTIDKVFRDGHYYSSKPALLPVVVAGITLAVESVTGFSLAPYRDFWLVRLVLLIVNFLPFALFVYFYGQWLRGLECGVFAKWFCLCCAAFGTYLTAYSITLNNHTVAALGVFFALFLFIKILTAESAKGFHYLMCGVFTGWTFANELIAWPFLFVIFGFLFKAHKGQTLKLFLPGALVVVGLFMLATYFATGDCVPFYLKHQLYQYPGSYWYHPHGIDAADEPKWLYIFHHILGHHGILSLSPIFVFAVAGMALARTFYPVRMAAIILTGINFVSVIFGSHNYGGACQGARWFMWLIPLWLFCMPLAVDQLVQSPRWKFFSILALLVSVASVLYAMLAYWSGPWSSSWIQDGMRAMGWVDY